MRHTKASAAKLIKTVAKDAVNTLLDQAESVLSAHPERSRRYVKMAFDLIKKHRLRLQREQRLRFCKKCFAYWVAGESVIISYEPKRHALLFKCSCGAKRRVINK